MTNNNITKERLQLALQRKDMLPAELARECGMSKGSISRYLAGTVIPKQSAVQKMAKALGVSPIWLLGFDDEVPSIIEEQPNGMEPINTKLLSEENFNRLLGYYYALLDTQGGKKA